MCSAGPSGLSGKKCYHCNATGHLYKDCPDRSKFRDAPDLEAIDKGASVSRAMP
eukprot:m.212939 g.212939  ORF g.212939 m.212939 type:complete len:54 (+) comp10757_c0_seq15:130-291(+)